MARLFALCVGIFSVAWWPRLPDFPLCLALLVSTIPLWLCRRLGWVACLVLGMFWGILKGHLLLESQLPENYDGRDILITGTVGGLVDRNSERSRFVFMVDSARLHSDWSQPIEIKKVLLSWYGDQQLQTGDSWQLVTRLRRPRGFVNPGTFDYQLWLHQQGYNATGYVRDSPLTEKLHSRGSAFIDRLRTHLQQRILGEEGSDLSPPGQAVILALTIGDKKLLANWWPDLARLGIAHLLVISGLHIGLIAFLGAILGSGLSRLAMLVPRLFPGTLSAVAVTWIAPVCGLMAAFLYSLLAGFSLPTQRALIAVTVVVVARLSYRKIPPLTCMLWALSIIAISQPLAVLSAGFWLSFTAVGLLIWWFSPWHSLEPRYNLRRTGTAQLALLIGMSVPLLLFLGRLSWWAPLVNLVAVPWVSFITVPLSLAGCAMPAEFLAQWFWGLADTSLSPLWWLLERLPPRAGFLISPLPLSGTVLVALLLAGLTLLLPRGICFSYFTRYLGLTPLLLLLFFPARPAPLQVTVLDVGQGLAVTVETENHTLVYDSGNHFSEQFSTGSGIVAPYLWQRGRAKLNTTVISHEDGDHSGGFASLEEVLPSDQVLVGPAVEFDQQLQEDLVDKGSLDKGQVYKGQVDKKKVSICQKGQGWHWDGVDFMLLAPEDLSLSGNNSSCVLQLVFIAGGEGKTVLLPGDIERSAELGLLRERALKPSVDLLVAPHHGSKTSSTGPFVEYLSPRHVAFSAGYRHHFNHPHQTVVSRYREQGSILWNTGEQGAIKFRWWHSGELEVSAARNWQKRWWR